MPIPLYLSSSFSFRRFCSSVTFSCSVDSSTLTGPFVSGFPIRCTALTFVLSISSFISRSSTNFWSSSLEDSFRPCIIILVHLTFLSLFSASSSFLALIIMLLRFWTPGSALELDRSFTVFMLFATLEAYVFASVLNSLFFRQ